MWIRSNQTDKNFVNGSQKNKSEQEEKKANLESSTQDNKVVPQLKNKPGKVYKRSEETRLKISKALKSKPSNSKRYWLGKGGPSHPLYKHGKGKNRDYDTIKSAAWIQGVKANSNFKCFATNQTNKSKLECDHLRSWEFEPGRYDIKNGVLLNKEIHKKFHAEYGYGENSPEQLERFLTENYNITFFPWRDENHEPILCLEKRIQSNESLREKRHKDFETLCSSREHIILEGEYNTIDSFFLIKCEHHKESFSTAARKYKRAKHGLPCCGKEAVIKFSKQAKRDEKGRFLT